MKTIAIPIPGKQEVYLIDIPETGADDPLTTGDSLIITLHKQNKALIQHLTDILQIFYDGNLNEDAVTFDSLTSTRLDSMKIDIKRLFKKA